MDPAVWPPCLQEFPHGPGCMAALFAGVTSWTWFLSSPAPILSWRSYSTDIASWTFCRRTSSVGKSPSQKWSLTIAIPVSALSIAFCHKHVSVVNKLLPQIRECSVNSLPPHPWCSVNGFPPHPWCSVNSLPPHPWCSVNSLLPPRTRECSVNGFPPHPWCSVNSLPPHPWCSVNSLLPPRTRECSVNSLLCVNSLSRLR